MSLLHPTQWQFRHRRGNKVIWASGIGDVDVALHTKEYEELLREQPFTPNELVNQGEEHILDVYFRGATGPTQFYIGLCNDTLVDTDTLATLTGEPAGNGYARVNQLIERSATGFPTLALDSGDFRTVTSTETITSTGTIGPVNTAFLATTSDNTGRLIAWASLSTARTLANTDSLDVSMAIKLA